MGRAIWAGTYWVCPVCKAKFDDLGSFEAHQVDGYCPQLGFGTIGEPTKEAPSASK